MISRVSTCLAGLLLGGLLHLAHASDFDHNHSLFAKILRESVHDGYVSYTALKDRPEHLARYLDNLAAVSPSVFAAWTRAQQIAFLVNLYNAATLDLIVQHYPVRSIKDIGGFFKGPWKQDMVRLFGSKVTLDHIEHGMLRKHYEEARIHFALVCAARGCPPLRGEPYVPERLERQLDEQGREFLSTHEKNHVDLEQRTIFLSPIFKWFAEDFIRQSGSVLAFVRPYFPAHISANLGQGTFSIDYTEYDWSLNDQKSGPPEEEP